MGTGDSNSNVSVEKVTPDTKTNDPIPRSDAGGTAPAAASPTDTAGASSSSTATTGSDMGIPEMTPNGATAPATTANNGTASYSSVDATADAQLVETGSRATRGSL